jgi:Phage tail tube protein
MTTTRFFAYRGPETVYGDGATGETWYKLRATGIGDPVNRNVAFEEALDIAAPTYAVGGTYVVNGTLDSTLRFGSMAPLFESMLGATAGTTYYLGDTPTSYAFCIGDEQANVQTSYYGCGISSMEFTFAVKEMVKVRMSWLGQKAQVIASNSHIAPEFFVAPTADNAAVFYNSIINVNSVPLRVKSLTLRIDRKFDTDYFYIGSPLLQGLYMNGQTEISGTMTLGGGEWTSLKAVMTGGQ